jgi:hypothetical protein
LGRLVRQHRHAGLLLRDEHGIGGWIAVAGTGLPPPISSEFPSSCPPASPGILTTQHSTGVYRRREHYRTVLNSTRRAAIVVLCAQRSASAAHRRAL